MLYINNGYILRILCTIMNDLCDVYVIFKRIIIIIINGYNSADTIIVIIAPSSVKTFKQERLKNKIHDTIVEENERKRDKWVEEITRISSSISVQIVKVA